MQEFDVANFPHKMIQWDELVSNKAMGKKVITYHFALGLTGRHPDMRNNCYFTVRHTYRMTLNNQPAFKAVGESVYKIRFKQSAITEELLLQLLRHAHLWFVKEFNERKPGTILQYTDEPSLIVGDVMPSIRESLSLAQYV
jgi:hypothetical protein